MNDARALVSTEWLAGKLGSAGLRIVDASWHMPHVKRDARAEFEAAHIPGAVFFDIDAIADRATGLPHMLPSADAFGEAAGDLGISQTDAVVVYDAVGIASSPRVWWTFRAFGHENVFVLDGGLPKWRSEGLALESGPDRRLRCTYARSCGARLVRNLEEMRRNLQTKEEQVVDARSAGRFFGRDPEPRPGLHSGHIPGSLNVPFMNLIAPDGTLSNRKSLMEAFQAAGVDLKKPIVTTCGSGITAAVLTLALYELGRSDVALYDGSWTEWGGRNDTPVARA